MALAKASASDKHAALTAATLSSRLSGRSHPDCRATPDSRFRPDRPGYTVQDEAREQPGEPVIVKTRELVHESGYGTKRPFSNVRAMSVVEGTSEVKYSPRVFRLLTQSGLSARLGMSKPVCVERARGPLYSSGSSYVRLLLRERWFSLCVTGEDKVARFDLIVAGEAGFHERLIARFAVFLQLTESAT
jgi:hypothetical protein